MSEEMFDENNQAQNQGAQQNAPQGLPPHLPPHLPNNLQPQQPTQATVEQKPLQSQPEDVEQPKNKKDKKRQKEVVDNKGRVVIKKKGGCGTFFAGFFFAIIFLVLSIGGAGAYVYFCVNLQQVESALGVKLPIEGDLNKKTIKDLISLGLEVKDSYVHMKVGELETKVGIKLPEKFPGTDIDITFLYDENTKINFKDNQITLKDIEVMDAINDLNSLVNGVLDVVYDHITVGEILRTADLEQTVEDMGWPALTKEIYDVAGSKKKLADLTINQAKDVLVDFYGEDNLTVEKLITATDLAVIPDDPKYDALRALKVQKLTTQDLLDNITGEILNDLFDLSEFEFTQTEEFDATTLSDMIDYLKSLYLGDFITLQNCVEEDFFTNHPTFSSLKTTFVSKLETEILNLKINQILTPTQIARTTLTQAQIQLSLPQLLQANPTSTVVSLLGATNVGEVGAYLNELSLTTTANFEQSFKDLSWAKRLGLDGSSTALLDLSSLKIKDIAESDDIPATIFDKLGTLGDLVGQTDNSILKMISSIKLSDLLTNAGDAITNALEYDADHNLNTLATLLDITSTDGINGIISGITVKALLDTPNDAISNALKNSTSTLGDLLEMDTTSGISSIIKNIVVGELFNTPQATIQSALEDSTMTLKDLLGISNENNTGINSIISGITVGALFTDQKAIENTLKSSETTLAVLLTMTSTDGINGVVRDIKVKDLFTNPNTAIKTALQQNTQTLKQFLGADTTSSPMADYVLTQLTVANLFDEEHVASTLESKIKNMPLSYVLGAQPTTGFLSLIAASAYNSATVGGIQDLIEGVDVAETKLGTLIDKGIITLDPTVYTNTTVVNKMREYTLMDIIKKFYQAVVSNQPITLDE